MEEEEELLLLDITSKLNFRNSSWVEHVARIWMKRNV
jgi:hypothetical protein